MIVLDTNVLSELMRVTPSPSVLSWVDRHSRHVMWTSAVSVMELRHGIEVMPPSRRRTAFGHALQALINDKIEHRIAAFDFAAAKASASLMASRQRAGRPGEIRDTMIAGIVLANHATLATRNTRHFTDLSVPVVNPWGD